MKAYHFKNSTENSKTDFLYIPDKDVFVAYLREPAMKTIIDYSRPRFLERAKAILDGKKDEVGITFSDEIELDERTASRIERKKSKIRRNLKDFDGSTEGLIRILAWEK